MIDIQAGDTVVCINARPCPVHGATFLVLGGVYRVAQVRAGVDKDTGAKGVGVKLVGHEDAPLWRNITSFRKVQPKSASKHIDRLKRVPSRQREGA